VYVLIVGYGSIGKRHAKIPAELNCSVSLVTSQQVKEHSVYSTLNGALKSTSFDYVVIANPTHLHHETLLQLIECGYRGVVLVEKPLYARSEFLPDNQIKKILVAYNLRFHELLLTAKEFLREEKLISFSVQVGQYLPTWRKNTDYRNCYSAKKEQGGGVLRDLSHELDYSLWFCGPCREVTAVGGKYSELEINSDDVYAITMRCEYCPIVTIQLNYLYRTPRREVIIQTQQHTVVIDLIQGVLTVDGEIKNQLPDAAGETYKKQHQAILSGDYTNCCDYAQGVAVVKLVEAIEQANSNRCWIQL